MHLKLRPFDVSDAPTVVSWVRDDRELRWLAPKSLPPLTPNSVIGWQTRLNRPYILESSPNTPIGYAEVSHSESDAANRWLGHIVLAPDHRGRGLGVQFVRMLLDIAFDVRAITRISLVVFPENFAAIACYQRCGFFFTRDEWHTFHPDGEKSRMKRFDLNRSAWEAESLPSRAAPITANIASRDQST